MSGAGDFRNVALDHGSGAVAVVAEATGLSGTLIAERHHLFAYSSDVRKKQRKGHVFMTPEEFYRGLEALGFTDCGVRSPHSAGTPLL
jgi:hypothetical protein